MGHKTSPMIAQLCDLSDCCLHPRITGIQSTLGHKPTFAFMEAVQVTLGGHVRQGEEGSPALLHPGLTFSFGTNPGGRDSPSCQLESERRVVGQRRPQAGRVSQGALRFRPGLCAPLKSLTKLTPWDSSMFPDHSGWSTAFPGLCFALPMGGASH